MELLKSSHRRSRISEMAYIALNVGLAIALLFVVWSVGSPWVAFMLVLVSKWRVFAVRPRFWAANILANTVDLIVSLSIVVFLYGTTGSLWLQIILTALYIGWLLWIKPRSKRSFVTIQAALAIFMGVTALVMVGYSWDSFFVVLLMWVIGFSAARHVLTGYDEPHATFLAYIWGLFIAELGWLGYHWTFAYSLPGFQNLKLVQIAIIAVAVSFVAERAYENRQRLSNPKGNNDLLMPALFVVSLIVVLVVFFNNLGGIGGLK